MANMKFIINNGKLKIVFCFSLLEVITSTSYPCFRKVVIENIKTIDGGGDVKVIGEWVGP